MVKQVDFSKDIELARSRLVIQLQAVKDDEGALAHAISQKWPIAERTIRMRLKRARLSLEQTQGFLREVGTMVT